MHNQFDDTHDDEWEYDGPSKSELKRESEKQQALGEALIALKPTELAKVPLDEELADAIELAHRLQGKREALRRQRQFLGRLMRSRDLEPIEQALAQIRSQHAAGNARLHRLEQWRERLLAGGDDAINALLAEHPLLDRQKLRQLVRQARKEQEAAKPLVAFRELFQYLRSEMEETL